MGNDSNILGTLLGGRYRATSIIGKGGMGTVYLGENVNIGKRVAIKVLNSELLVSKEYMQRFQREARAAAEIGHPHIVDIYDFGWSQDGVPFIVMEALDGEGLDRVLARTGPLEPFRSVDVAGQVLHALQATHDIGIVHRDLKPENVYLCKRQNLSWRGDTGSTGRDYVKVLDFGISRFVKHTGTEQNLTQTGAIFGTPSFMAPEQAKGKKSTDHRADIYAVGALLYNMLSGHAPFRGDSIVEILAEVIKGNCPRLGELRPMLPAGLVEVVYRAMSLDPESRYQTATEFMGALRPFSNLDPSDSFVSHEPVQMASPAAAKPAQQLPKPRPAPAVAESTMRQFTNARAEEDEFADEESAESLLHQFTETRSEEEPRPPAVTTTQEPVFSEPPIDLTRTPSTFVLTAQNIMSSRRRTAIIVAVPAVLLLFIGGFFLVRSWQERAASDAPPAIAGTSAGSAPVAKAPADEAAGQPRIPAIPAPGPDTTAISVKGLPGGASVLLDSKPIGVLPYEGTVLADGKEHELGVRMAGYTSHSELVVLSPGGETAINVHLDVEAAPPSIEEIDSSATKKKKKKTKDGTAPSGTWWAPEPAPKDPGSAKADATKKPQPEEKTATEEEQPASATKKKGGIIRDVPFE